MSLKYSIIIAVYNRLAEVKELLASAEELDFPRTLFELLFVDDGSTDGFREFIQSYRSTSGLQLRWLYQNNQGPGAARNYGMANSTAQYFIFVDSDCLFPPMWLKRIDRHLQRHRCDAFGGPDEAHASFTPFQKAVNHTMTSYIGTLGTRGKRRAPERFYPRSFNMGIHRRVYEAIGGMDTSLRHGQDMDYSARIYKAGFRVCLIADAYVYHKRRTDWWKFFKQIFNWGVARIALYRRHREMLKWLHLLPLVVWVGGIGIVVAAMLRWLPLWVLSLFIAMALLLSFLLMVGAWLRYREWKTALWTPIVFVLQVGAYGLGLAWGLWQHWKGKEPRGFVKNYYGKNK